MRVMQSPVTTCIPLTAPDEWDAALEGIDHAFAHSWESCAAMHLTASDPTFLFVCESGPDRFVCPFAERRWRGTVDVFSPYGFGGFVGTGLGHSALDLWREFATARGYVCGYIGLNPVLTDNVDWGPGTAETYNEVFLLDLRLSEQRLFDALSTNRKRNVEQWRRAGAPLVADRDVLSTFFLDRYHAFMTSRGAAAVYQFANATLERLLMLESVFLVGSADDDGINAVAVFACTGAVGDYLFGVSKPSGRHNSAALVWEGAMLLRRMRVPVLNLGGGIRLGDGVADFKRRFGARPAPLQRVREVYDAIAFDTLCRTAGVDAHDWSGYFPPYRGRD